MEGDGGILQGEVKDQDESALEFHSIIFSKVHFVNKEARHM